MHLFAFLGRRKGRARFLWLGLLAMVYLGLAGAFTPDAVKGAGESQIARDPGVRSPNAQPWVGNSIRRGASQESPIMRLASARVRNDNPPGRGGVSGGTNQVPTYLRDILPILMRRCSRCHNKQAQFVYNWLDYRTAYTDRWEIRRRVWDSWRGWYYKESMPISNSPESLAITEGERSTIKNWVEDGAPRGVPPPPGAPKSKAEKIELGRRLFVSICAACHQPTGRGIPNMFPPLAGSDFLNADKKRAIKIVINGRQGQIVVNGMRFNNSMPSFPLSNDDIANVLTFVYNSFGNSGVEVTPDEVRLLRAEPPDQVAPSTTPAPAPYNPYE